MQRRGSSMPPLKMMAMLSPLGVGGAAPPAATGGRLGVEGNTAQLTLAKVFKNLAPNVPGLMGTDDEATPTRLYNGCAEPLLMPALRQLVEVRAGLDVIVEMAGGNVENLAENVERAARALLGEILASRFGGEGEDLESMSPDLFMKLCRLAPKMFNELSDGEFDDYMKNLEAQLLIPGYVPPAPPSLPCALSPILGVSVGVSYGVSRPSSAYRTAHSSLLLLFPPRSYANELLKAHPDFLNDLRRMLESGEKDKVVPASRLLDAFTKAIPINEGPVCLDALKDSKCNGVVANSVAPAFTEWGDTTLLHNLDGLLNCANAMGEQVRCSLPFLRFLLLVLLSHFSLLLFPSLVLVCNLALPLREQDASAWSDMGLDAPAYEALRDPINAFRRADAGSEGADIYQTGLELLELLRSKHDITPEYDLGKAIADGCPLPEEYGALLQTLQDMAECAERSVGKPPLIAEEQMSALCSCLLKHAADADMAMALARLLNKLAENEGNLSNIAKFGGLEGIIQALIANPENTPLLRVLIHLLEKFVKNDVFKEKIGQLDGCKALLLCLATHCDARFVNELDAERDDGEDGGAPTSVRGDLSDHDVMLVAMLSLIANLSFNSRSNIGRIVAENGVAAIDGALQFYAAKPRVLEAAMANLSNWMAGDNGCMEAVGETCTPRIIAAVSEHPEDAKLFKMTMRAMGNMSTVDDNIAALINQGSVRVIVEAIQGDALAADQGCQTIAIQVRMWLFISFVCILFLNSFVAHYTLFAPLLRYR
jgi:hypothetical protein